MKKLSLVIVLLGIFAVAGISQERETTMAELSPKLVRSSAIQTSAPFRCVTVTERYDKKGGQVIDRTTTTQEVITSTTLRSTTEYWPEKDRPSVEQVSVAGVKYRRIGGQGWKLVTGVFSVVNSGTGVGSIAGPIPIRSEQSNKVFSLGNELLDGKTTGVYEMRVTVTKTYSSGEISKALTDTRYWFFDNGELAKRLTVTDDVANGVYAKTTLRFAYENINTKIEVPVLDSEKSDK